MKIVNRKEFLELPEGTVYSKYMPQCFGPIDIKMESTLYNDWWYSATIDNIDGDSDVECMDLADKALRGEEVALCFETESRDGLHDKDQLFAIYSQEDIKKLIKRLRECIDDGI